MTMTLGFAPFTCPSCGHTDQLYGPAELQCIRCDACGARIAHGVLMPKVTVHPHADRRFTVLRLEMTRDGETVTSEHVLVNAFANEIAMNVASITKTATQASGEALVRLPVEQ
jgi:hypothetical protein